MILNLFTIIALLPKQPFPKQPFRNCKDMSFFRYYNMLGNIFLFQVIFYLIFWSELVVKHPPPLHLPLGRYDDNCLW